MNAQTLQIVKAYEELHLSIQDIAEDQEVSITEIKCILAQFSVLYRKNLRADEKSDDNFTEEESARVKQEMLMLKDETQDDNLKFRILKYVRQDKKGRLDVVKNLQTVNVNLALFNQQVKRMRNAASEVMGIPCSGDQKKVIDV